MSSAHVAFLHDRIRAVLVEGIADGAFAAGEPAAMARAVLHATTRFHDPRHAADWRSPETAAESEAVISLVLDGIRGR